VINLDPNTAIAFVAEGSNVRRQLKVFAQNQELVMAPFPIPQNLHTSTPYLPVKTSCWSAVTLKLSSQLSIGY
jgi:hypothetical protein